MDHRKLKPQATLFSIEGQPRASKVVYYDTDTDNDGTELEQCSDSVSTTSVQSTNNVSTASVQRQDKNKTDIARGSKRPPETHQSVYAEYAPIVKLLTSRNFIRLNTSNTYSSLTQLPLSRAPKDLTEAVNAAGFNISRDDLAKIYTAAIVCTRVPKWKVRIIVIFTIIVTTYAVRTSYRIFAPDAAQPTAATASIVQSLPSSLNDDAATHAATLDAAIAEWESAGGQKIYPGGRACLLAASVGMTKQQILELIKNNVK